MKPCQQLQEYHYRESASPLSLERSEKSLDAVIDKMNNAHCALDVKNIEDKLFRLGYSAWNGAYEKEERVSVYTRRGKMLYSFPEGAVSVEDRIITLIGNDSKKPMILSMKEGANFFEIVKDIEIFKEYSKILNNIYGLEKNENRYFAISILAGFLSIPSLISVSEYLSVQKSFFESFIWVIGMLLPVSICTAYREVKNSKFKKHLRSIAKNISKNSENYLSGKEAVAAIEDEYAQVVTATRRCESYASLKERGLNLSPTQFIGIESIYYKWLRIESNDPYRAKLSPEFSESEIDTIISVFEGRTSDERAPKIRVEEDFSESEVYVPVIVERKL